MALTVNGSMEVKLSVAAGAPLDVSEYVAVRFTLSGTFTATIQLEESPDGTAWNNLETALTAPGTVNLAETIVAKFVRANTTAYTSGTPVLDYAARR